LPFPHPLFCQAEGIGDGYSLEVLSAFKERQAVMTYAARSLKRAVLREEFAALTGDAFQALVLNQFIYWVQKVNDFDDFIREEQERNPDCNVSLRHGWIYKKAQDLIEETMLQMSDITMRRIIKALVEKGWIEERTNPDNRWNKVLQYRPDLKKIQQDLYGLGYALPGFPLLQPAQRSEAPKLQNEVSNLQTNRFILKDTETTSEITAKKSADTREDVSKLMLETWNSLLCPPVLVQMTTERSQRLTAILADHFENKLDCWSSFCQEITQSAFLMGKGQRGWRVTLDWLLDSRNLHKTLEGNYRDSEASPASSVPEKLSSQELKLKIDQHLESLPHALSRQFCRALLRYLPEQKVLFWFSEAALSGWEDSRLVLSFPSRATRDYVERHFSSEMGSAARSVCPHLQSLTLTIQQTAQESQVPSAMTSPLLTGNSAPSKALMLPSGDGISPDESDPSQTFPPLLKKEEQEVIPQTLETRQQAETTAVLESSASPMTNSPAPSKAQLLPSRDGLSSDEHQTLASRNNTDIPVSPAEGCEPTVFNPCFFSEEQQQTPSSSLFLQRSCEQDHDLFSALHGCFSDRDDRRASLTGGSARQGNKKDPSSNFLQSCKEEDLWKKHVKTLLTPCLPSSSHPLTERSPS
jgi:DNA-binding MarR family transcriptional regulator